jgi:hypothetical protein
MILKTWLRCRTVCRCFVEERLDVLCRDQAGVVPECSIRKIDKPAHELVARYLGAHHDGATLVEANEVESILAEHGRAIPLPEVAKLFDRLMMTARRAMLLPLASPACRSLR